MSGSEISNIVVSFLSFFYFIYSLLSTFAWQFCFFILFIFKYFFLFSLYFLLLLIFVGFSYVNWSFIWTRFNCYSCRFCLYLYIIYAVAKYYLIICITNIRDSLTFNKVITILCLGISPSFEIHITIPIINYLFEVPPLPL